MNKFGSNSSNMGMRKIDNFVSFTEMNKLEPHLENLRHFIISPHKTSTTSLLDLFVKQIKLKIYFCHNFLNKGHNGGLRGLITLPSKDELLQYKKHCSNIVTMGIELSAIDIIRKCSKLSSPLPIYIYIVYREPFDRMISSFMQFHKQDPTLEIMKIFETAPEQISSLFNDFIRTGQTKYGMIPITYDYLSDLDVDIFQVPYNPLGGNTLSSKDNKIIVVLGRMDKLDIFKSDIESIVGMKLHYEHKNITCDFFGKCFPEYLKNALIMDKDIVDLAFKHEAKYIEHFYGTEFLNTLKEKWVKRYNSSK